MRLVESKGVLKVTEKVIFFTMILAILGWSVYMIIYLTGGSSLSTLATSFETIGIILVGLFFLLARYVMDFGIVAHKIEDDIEKEKYQEALNKLDKKIGSKIFFTDKKQAQYLHAKGYVLLRKGDFQKAHETFKEALCIKEGYPPAWYGKAVTETKTDQINSAVNSLEKTYSSYRKTFQKRKNIPLLESKGPKQTKNWFINSIKNDMDLKELHDTSKFEELLSKVENSKIQNV